MLMKCINKVLKLSRPSSARGSKVGKLPEKTVTITLSAVEGSWFRRWSQGLMQYHVTLLSLPVLGVSPDWGDWTEGLGFHISSVLADIKQEADLTLVLNGHSGILVVNSHHLLSPPPLLVPNTSIVPSLDFCLCPAIQYTRVGLKTTPAPQEWWTIQRIPEIYEETI